MFDDEEFESRTPNEWLELGYEEGSNDRKPIPGNALLPKDDKLGHGTYIRILCWMSFAFNYFFPFSSMLFLSVSF